MKYLICILAVLFCASVAEAHGFRYETMVYWSTPSVERDAAINEMGMVALAKRRPAPVRNAVKNTGRVILWPFKNHCPNGVCPNR